MKCLIASQLEKHPHAPSCSGLSYSEFNTLIGKVTSSLRRASTPIVSFVPKGTPLDIAFFFAAWRLGLCVYPLSFRLPKQEIQQRARHIGATLVIPNCAHTPLHLDTVDPTAIATCLETSSGSKIACHCLSAHLASAHAASQALELRSSDAYCLNLPLFHISGIATVIRTFLAGAHLLLKEQINHATHLSAVSTQLYRYVRDQTPLPRLKCLLIGGSPLPENLRSAPYPICTTYGMTEAASMISFNGKILPHIQAKIDRGQIWIQGPSLLSHYANEKPVKSWFPTGNTGYFEENHLQITGRIDRVFISGGEKIQPETIEKVLLEIPGVVQVRVVPMHNLEYGHVPKAKIQAEREITYREISSFLEKKLPRYMIPKRIENSRLLTSKLSKMG